MTTSAESRRRARAIVHLQAILGQELWDRLPTATHTLLITLVIVGPNIFCQDDVGRPL